MAEDGDADCFNRFGVGVGVDVDGIGIGTVAAGWWVVLNGKSGVGKGRLRGGLEPGFGIFVFEALNHALEGSVKKLESLLSKG